MTPDHDEDRRPERPDRRTDLLGRLRALNPTAVVFGALALFLGVLLLPDAVGAALILLIVALLGWLLRHTWPVLPPPARALRLVVLGALLVVALLKLTV